MSRPDAPFTGPALCALSAREMVARLRKGEVGAEEAIAAAAARIDAVEPSINAMPTRCTERAGARVAALAGGERGHPAWLAGLPIAIKDLTNVAGVPTSFGNTALAGVTPEASDPLVERLEARGGLVMGKTNTPEFGAGGNTTNAVFGPTRNPWNIALNAGGSSGGAAAALAAGEVWLAHGSDLMGSLRTPAAHCGVLGLRPAPGRCGGGPAAASFLAEGLQGPMARDVADLALFLDAMTGWDARMPLSLEAPAQPFQSTLEGAEDAPPRIAFAEGQNGFAPVEGEIRAVLRAAMDTAARAGARVEEACPDLPGLADTYLTFRAVQYGTLTARQPAPVRAAFGQRVRENVAQAERLTAEAIFDAQRGRATLYETMRVFLEGHDVLAIPVVGIAPGPVEELNPTVIDGQEVETYEDWLRFSFLATAAMLPALSMPCGFTPQGLPVGLQLVGPPRGEAVLLRAARFIEAALDLPATPIDPRQPG